MTETLPRLLLRLSEAPGPAILWGRLAARHAGHDVERLLARGVLVEQAPATEWDVCPACDCGLEARPIQLINGQRMAICPTDRRRDLILDDDDLRSFRIDPARLIREISVASGLSDGPSLIAEGVWHLGEIAGQRELFLALSGDALLQAGMIGLMREVARSLPVTVIAPAMPAADRMRFVEAGALVVPTEDCLGGNATGLAIDPATLASVSASEPRLVIFRQSQRVTLGGEEVPIPLQPFHLLVKLAEAVGGRRGYLTPRQIEVDNRGRNPADLVRELRDHLQDPEKLLIRTRYSPTRYFLALAPEEVDLRL